MSQNNLNYLSNSSNLNKSNNKNDYFLRVVFCFFSLIFVLLLSYKLTINLVDVTESQQQTLDFLKGGELSLDYTLSEISHLEDVRRVMTYAEYAFYLSLLICTVIITYYRHDSFRLKKMFFLGGISILIFVILVLFVIFTNFNFIFSLFHQLFFPQGNWIFSEESLLIQTFPLDFFVKASQMIFAGSFTFGVVMIIASKGDKISFWIRKNILKICAICEICDSKMKILYYFNYE